MARSLALAVALLALAVAVATAASQQPNAQVFDKTATGQPVISANANEIVNVHDENEDTSKASLEKEADETLHQLKITKQLEAKRRAERREKHAEEQAFKTREAENKQDHLQIHQEKFKDHMSKKAEEGTKTAEEARAKSAAKVDLENKLSEKKKEKKLDAVRKAAKIDQLHIDNARKVWETSMELKRKHIYEEQSKSKERVGKAMEERATKKRTREGARKRKREMHAKSENHAKNKEADSKRHREQHNKREVRRAAARAAEASEEQQKSALDQRDRQHEEAFKAARAAKERQRKALEEAKKRAERREKLRERNEKAAEKEKKRQEQEAKEGAKKAAHRAEQHEKAKRRAERQQKEQQKKWRMNAQLNWCHCNYVYKPWGSYNNAWFTCGGQSLLIGWHRYWAQDLSSISHLHCCHACRPNGQVMKTENCHSADWVRSFDVQGWSFCPKDHYIKGFYKSSCNWIYCLEYAMCCKIEGSRSYKSCSTLSRWVHQNDYAGWKSLDGNHFMVGLYRSSGHYLYNIEQPQQCTANAYKD